MQQHTLVLVKCVGAERKQSGGKSKRDLHCCGEPVVNRFGDGDGLG